MISKAPLILLFLLSVNIYSQESLHPLWMKGVAASMQGNYQEAVDCFTRLILADSSGHDYFMRRGNAWLMTGNTGNALADFLSAEKRKAGSASFQIAQCYALMNKPEEATSWLRKHLQAPGRLPEAKIRLDKSLRHIENTVEWKELWSNDWYTRPEQNTAEATYLIESGKPLEAVAQITEWLTRNPRRHEWYFLRARGYLLLNNKNNALKDLNQAIELNKRQPEYYWQRGLLLLESGKYAKAAEDFSRVLKLDPSRLETYRERAKALAGNEKFKGATEDIALFTSLFPNDPQAHYTNGFILYAMRKYSEAIEALNRSIELDHSVPDFFYQRGLCSLELRNYRNAIYDFAQALDLNPEDADAWYQRGIARLYNGDKEGSCSDFKKAATLGSKEAYKQYLQICQEY